jgi:pimeloyl-ACP methyl ester carboxylesterase
MRWRRTVVAGSAAVGAAAAWNAWTRRGVGSYANPLGGVEGTYRWRGHRIAYTAHGAGTPLVLVHDVREAASSFEWRRIVDPLAAHFHVHAIDLLGFGRSARPAARYRPRLYTSLLADFVADVVAQPVALVAAGRSASYAIELAARDPARFPALALVAPVGPSTDARAIDAVAEARRVAVELPVVGTTLFNARVTRAATRRRLERLYADDRRVTEALVDHHYLVSHQPGARYAPAALLAGRLDLDPRAPLRRLRQPALLVWGEHAAEHPVDEARAFLAGKPDLEVAILPRAGDVPHDEQPAAFLDAVLPFLERFRAGSRGVRTPSPASPSFVRVPGDGTL